VRAPFSPIQWLMLCGYVVFVTGFGSMFYRKRSSAADFFLGGREMLALPVAISLVAADVSAITYMGCPAWTYQHNLEILWSSTASLLVAMPVVMYLFMPFYMKLNLYTGYEYLERRFDLRTRLVVSGLFLLMRGCHVAIAIYAPSLVLSILTGLPLYSSVLIMGVFTTLYTALGGMKAVIWTDVFQFSILMSGMMAVFWFSLSRIPGGVATVYSVASQAGRTHFMNFSFNPHEMTAFWPSAFGGGALVLSYMATDQTYMQRYFSTRSLREGRYSIVMDVLIILPLSCALYLLGDVLFAFYHFHPSNLQGLPNVDAILPFFVLHELGGVFSGLVIASIFASSMAVMSAGVNALTTATTVDFYRRWLRPQLADAHYVKVGRWGTVAWGTLCTAGAMFVSRLGPIAIAINKITAFLGGPMLGIFLLGILSRRAKGRASLTGAAVAVMVVSWITWRTSISFFYHSLIGATVTFAFGYLLSLWGPVPDKTRLVGLVRGIQDELREPTEANLLPNQS
jgi:SSS family transporter